jgi:hypothetical protein
VALVSGQRGSGQNSGGSPVLAAGERRGRARGVSKTRIAQDLGGGAAGPARELHDDGQRTALRVWFRGDRRLTEARRGRVSYRGG